MARSSKGLSGDVGEAAVLSLPDPSGAPSVANGRKWAGVVLQHTLGCILLRVRSIVQAKVLTLDGESPAGIRISLVQSVVDKIPSLGTTVPARTRF